MNSWIDATTSCLMAVFVAYQMADIAKIIGLRWFLVSLVGIAGVVWWAVFCFTLMERMAA